MGSTDETTGDDGVVEAGLGYDTFRLRSYQAEMVEESMRGNIIVAMDTGSGKTHIALARTAAELEVCETNKIVWFLAPTVTLCKQQFDVFQLNLPGFGIQMLSGDDNVDHWSDQAVWDGILHNIRIVLSTHKVLLDALTHGFVRIQQLALIIFDEAHHCVSNHPANQIMSNFYIPLVATNDAYLLPRVLGLSASPVMKARASGQDLQKIERNLNAIARSPKLHRSELIRFVHRPKLIKVTYPAVNPGPSKSHTLDALKLAYKRYDITTDPYVDGLLNKLKAGVDCSGQIQKVIENGKTYCKEQLRILVDKGTTMMDELGPSPTDWYISQCIEKYGEAVQSYDQQSPDWLENEKRHLSNILQKIPVLDCTSTPILLSDISAKVDILIDVLVTEAGPDFTGIVFVEQRVWVIALAEIISLHPRTKDIFNVGTFVGTSNSAKRRLNIADTTEPRNQQTTLADFRLGKKNLIFATSVLEEGIDISSCRLVICFERPKNLKSFVQRRGRARKQESKYIIFIPDVGDERTPEAWEALEEEMKQAYLNDEREIKAAEDRELQKEDSKLYYQVSKTGAILTIDNALQHLHHFCALLGSGPFVDSRPQFTFSTNAIGKIMAQVTLPTFVDPDMRLAKSEMIWATERMAKNDAAFQAYKALHHAGLVNDNLLPAHEEVNDEAAEFQIPDHTPSLVQVSAAFDPWTNVARNYDQNPQVYHQNLLQVKLGNHVVIEIVLCIPLQGTLPSIPEFPLYWNETREYTGKIISLGSIELSDEELAVARSITWMIMQPTYASKMQEERPDFLWLILPSDRGGHIWDISRLRDWKVRISGTTFAQDLVMDQTRLSSDWGLVSYQGDNRKYIINDIDYDTGVPRLLVTRQPKRRDFLHRIVEGTQKTDAYTKVESFLATDCMVDNLPFSYSLLALFLPSILHKYEVFMLANTLMSTILNPLSFEPTQISLLVQALTSSATGEEKNYQRLEFLGDCILKFISSVHLSAAKLNWPEGYLTRKKGKIVSNGYLARATMSLGLDAFILTKRFTGNKWLPRFANDVLNPPAQCDPPVRSSKLLADVIESLIGTSYVIGGFPKAFTCVQTLLTQEKWTPIPEANITLYDAVPTGVEYSGSVILETLIGHTFTKKALLLEACTHASYNGPNANVRSYERLEFLGDAVLDYIISKRLYAHAPELSHQKMHAIRSSMANASFLAFRMLETTIQEPMTNKKTLEPEYQSRALYMYMRHSGGQLLRPREIALKQHNASRDVILAALHQDSRFPWHLFALNDAPKFLSDIVESALGAIYVDTKGDIEACENFVERLGILSALERILRDGVDCLHPKERLGHLAVEKSVQYVHINEVEMQGLEGDGNKAEQVAVETEEKAKMYKVQVMLGGVEVGGAVEGLKRLNAETIAAWKAVGILEGKAKEDVAMADESEDEWFDTEEGGGVALNGFL
ncbi:dicer-like protein 2 [Dendryphion nanum]|uniref:Dicer-like protein 2 n=1 Tax=Dendryphion nanum TaxID=256645 RepID=A0A9P9DNN9_9PLEO|nr:dicer-like protein 2 [Dendryphion nanum]